MKFIEVHIFLFNTAFKFSEKKNRKHFSHIKNIIYKYIINSPESDTEQM